MILFSYFTDAKCVLFLWGSGIGAVIKTRQELPLFKLDIKKTKKTAFTILGDAARKFAVQGPN